MGHSTEIFKTKGKGFEEELPPFSDPIFHEDMTPPPSYRLSDFDGLCTDQASRQEALFGNEMRNPTSERGRERMPRNRMSRHEELTTNHKPRHGRRRHRRRR